MYWKPHNGFSLGAFYVYTHICIFKKWDGWRYVKLVASRYQEEAASVTFFCKSIFHSDKKGWPYPQEGCLCSKNICYSIFYAKS